MKIVDLIFYNYKKKSTEEIIDGCRQGNTQCQEVLFERYAPLIMTVCRRYEQPDFGASDILQETFILVFRKIHQFDSNKGNIESWIKKIAVNTALKVIRKRKIKFVNIDDNQGSVKELPEESIEIETISEEYLLEKIKELPPGYRMVFNLYVIEGYTHKEIAQQLNISDQTSKSQLSKAKKLLRSKLKDHQLLQNRKTI